MFGDNVCGNVSAPIALSFTSASLSIMIALVSIPGNLLVLLAVLLDPNKDLRCPFNYFVSNLAFADLLVGCVVAPMSAIFHICEGMEVHIIVPIESLHLMFFITCTASVLSLAALTVDRYGSRSIKISLPKKDDGNDVIDGDVSNW